MFAAGVGWTAATDNGIADAAGVRLPAGDLVLLGAFNIPDSTIQANSGNVAFLMSHFAIFGSTTIGHNVGGQSGFFFQNTVGNTATTTPFPVQNLQIYIWAFNSSSSTTATQQGIFSQTAEARWIFPTQGGIPDTTNIDITDLTDGSGMALAAGADIVVGNFRQGVNNTLDFNLALIPEPSTYALALVGGLGLWLLSRRRSAAPRG